MGDRKNVISILSDKMLILVSGVWFNTLQVIVYITEEIIHVFRYIFAIRDTMPINY